MMEIERRHEEAQAHIRATIMTEFCHVMSRSGLPPMAVMRLAAQAVGSIYREIAETHSGPNACPCNWSPNERTDIDVLCTALMAAIRFKPVQDLRAMRPAGSA
ncbi:hypothetical protein ASD64_07855 [Mesorhizobium sp. Root157]|nr:hypothetical protein ASD64_07855 [Mesorhizobium sp. Root157]